VVSRRFPSESKERIRKLLFTMHQDPEGKKLLDELMIDRFIPLQEEWYATLKQMNHYLARRKDPSHAP
jgi:phosphonate transport system substrate-binding protein